MTNVAIFGAGGRMGRGLIRLVSETAGLQLTGALVSPGSERLGRDSGDWSIGVSNGIVMTDQPSRALADAQTVIDFTTPDATLPNVDACLQTHCPIVIGTTGLPSDTVSALQRRAKSLAIVYAPNTSLGANVLFGLLTQAMRAIDQDVDVEIIEAHHRFKADAPSGTALRLGEIVASARDAKLDKVAVFDRHGQTGPRPAGGIGFSVVRAGDIVGEHTVLLASEYERLELTHRASKREAFAAGAIRAARWIIGQPPGFYSMQDVLGL